MPSQKLSNIAALDGIRGIAILAVMFHHFATVFQNGGSRLDRVIYAVSSRGMHGVDLFFVLSGFLITRILMKSRASEGYLKSFYMRRILRIFPVYFLYIFVVFAIVRQVHPQAYLHVHIWPYLTYLSNWKKGTGFTDFGLGHIWSLAVEEQFYLLWPLLILWCPPRRLLYVSAAICVLALGLRVGAILGHGAPQIMFRMTPFRADALAGGAIIAVLFESTRRIQLIKRFAIPAAVSLLLLALAVNGRSYAEAFRLSAIMSVCAAAVLFAASHNPSFLRVPFLTTVGKYSYGMYVYHILLGSIIWAGLKTLTLVPLMALKLSFLPIAGIVVFAVSWLSYRYFESPFLQLKHFFIPGQKSTPAGERAADDSEMIAPSALAEPVPDMPGAA